MERKYRNDMSDQQKTAISNSLKGRRHSEEHKMKIARALEKYWSKLPYKPETETDNNKTTTDKIYGKDSN